MSRRGKQWAVIALLTAVAAITPHTTPFLVLLVSRILGMIDLAKVYAMFPLLEERRQERDADGAAEPLGDVEERSAVGKLGRRRVPLRGILLQASRQQAADRIQQFQERHAPFAFVGSTP